MQKAESVRTDWVSAGLRRQVAINALICALCAAALILPIVIGDHLLRRLELTTADFLTEERGGGTAASQMVLIGIDDASLDVLDVLDEDEVVANPQLDAMSFGFPFPRSVYAAMTQKLLDAGARLVVFDMLFTGASDGDEEFKAVIDANPTRVVLGCDFVEDEIAETNAIASKARFTLPSDTLLQSDDPLDHRVGYVNFFPDADLKVRALQPMMRAYPHLNSPVRHSLAMAC
ncbi:MAG: CHASE2 domain-containing protein, partial [Verrucomicrobiales bacterium]